MARVAHLARQELGLQVLLARVVLQALQEEEPQEPLALVDPQGQQVLVRVAHQDLAVQLVQAERLELQAPQDPQDPQDPLV